MNKTMQFKPDLQSLYYFHPFVVYMLYTYYVLRVKHVSRIVIDSRDSVLIIHNASEAQMGVTNAVLVPVGSV